MVVSHIKSLIARPFSVLSTLIIVVVALVTSAPYSQSFASGYKAKIRTSSGYKAKPSLRGALRSHRSYHSKRPRIHDYSRGFKPTGPRVINVRKALSRKRLKIRVRTHNPSRSNLTPHIIDQYSGQVRKIYYDDAKCDGGAHCIVRLGTSRSSPKVIILGEGNEWNSAGPHIIHPPL